MAIKKITAEELNDLSPMPFGQHRGIPMQDVPVEYLHWCWNQTATNDAMKKVHRYIAENIDALRMENDDLLWSK